MALHAQAAAWAAAREIVRLGWGLSLTREVGDHIKRTASKMRRDGWSEGGRQEASWQRIGLSMHSATQ